MRETYYANNTEITETVGEFPGVVISHKWSAPNTRVQIGQGFSLLSKRDPLAVGYMEQQTAIGYKPKSNCLLLYSYESPTKIAFSDEAFQKFLRLALAKSLASKHKILPRGYAVVCETEDGPALFRPRNYLTLDDYRTISFERRQVALKTLQNVLPNFARIDLVLSTSNNTKIFDALSYFLDYLRSDDPKIQIVLLTMILEVLFIEDDNASELQTKLMMRLSKFLHPGKSKINARIKLSEFIKDAYGLRSSVVHGSEFGKIINKAAKKTSISPSQYMSSHITQLAALVSTVLCEILDNEGSLALMSKYPRKPDDSEVVTFYRELLIG